jgi:glycosyltransferase involved in cell wall biosynthesis
MKVHACLMTQNEATDLIENVRGLLPHVDSVTVVDGGSQDLTIPYMRNWERAEPKLRFFIHPWRDNFPEQRNNYLRRVAEIATDGDWVLVCDPDEFFSEEALTSLRRLAEVAQAKRERFKSASFQCRSVSLQGGKRTWENLDSYWKTLFFRWSSGLKYGHHGDGAVHETLHGITPTYQTGHHPEFPALTYEHRKQENVIWPRGARNLFIGGGGPNLGSKNPRWMELRAIADRLGLKTWREFNAYLIAGNIDGSLKDWIVRHQKTSGFDGASEHREVYKTYFRLYHPEEEPAALRGEHIE